MQKESKGLVTGFHADGCSLTGTPGTKILTGGDCVVTNGRCGVITTICGECGGSRNQHYLVGSREEKDDGWLTFEELMMELLEWGVEGAELFL